MESKTDSGDQSDVFAGKTDEAGHSMPSSMKQKLINNPDPNLTSAKIQVLKNDDGALRQLLTEHRLLKDTIEQSPLQFCVYDEHDDLIAWNKKYEETHPEAFGSFYGSGAEKINYAELVWHQQAKVVPQAELEQSVTDLVEAQRNADGHARERQYDSMGWLRVIKYPLPNGGIAGMAVNITELKEREKELEEARNKAEAAERSKSEFLANMSHEIRTPMNGILGMAELLTTTGLTAKQATFSDVILNSGNALLTIINDILDFSKIEAGLLTLMHDPFDLGEAIEDVATLVSARVAEKDLELIVRIDPDLPKTLDGDAGRIRQIVTNLLGNAVKFTETGHVYIDVQSKGTRVVEGTEVARVLFNILDTGVGIPKEKCDTIFEKFTQVDASATRKHEGTGLGLSISRSLVELMGGEIGVTSDVGTGSTFWFEIELPIIEHAIPLQESAENIKDAKVIVIDDNQVNRSILLEQTKSWGYESIACKSGKEGLAVLEMATDNGIEIDVLILDYQMPDMSGDEVLELLRGTPKLQNIPVILLTSVDQAMSDEKIRGLGVEANLTKPARSSLLLETVQSVISTHRNNPQRPVAKIAKPDAPEASPAVTIINDEVVAENNRLDILIAEDNEVNQIVYEQVFNSSGLSYRIVENGKLAVSAFQAQNPKLILMDVSMPEMNGHEATRKIRSLEEGNSAHTPIVGVTAHALKGDMEKCEQAGMDDYLSKPISPKKLMEKVRFYLEDPAGKKIAG